MTNRLITAGLMCLVALAAASPDIVYAAPARVTGITMHEAAGDILVSIAASGPVRYRLRNVRAEWVVVDLFEAELGIAAGRVPVSGGSVSQIRVGQFLPNVVRVVVEMARPAHVNVVRSRDDTAVLVRIPAHETVGEALPRGTASDDGLRGEIAKVTEIALWGTSSKPWVSITASGPVRYQLRKIESDAVVIDVSRARLALVSGRPPAGRGLVQQIRVGQLTPDVVRVVLKLAQTVPIHIATSANRGAIVVSLAPGARTHAGAVPAQKGGNAVPASPQQPAAIAPSTSVDQPVAASSTPTAQSAAPPQPASGPQTAGRPSDSGYLLGPSDVLEITVWGYGDLTRIVTVRPDGKITVPLAGTVPAAGRSTESLTNDLTRAFAKYIINPQVTVSVREFRKIVVSMLGQVGHPGTYTLTPGARILDAISAASGVTDNAALTQAQLVRASGETRPVSLDGLLLRQEMSLNLRLEPGDTLIIPQDTTNKFYVVGDVNRPGMYPITGDVTVLQALAIAGGPVMHGTTVSHTAHIIRRVDQRVAPVTASLRREDEQPIANGNGVMLTKDLQKIYQGDLRQNEVLRPGDVMVVPAPGIAALPTILSILPFLWWLHP